ncbi:hypothetical protein ACA910_016659 [Epithemia clementina (nom. ined.)]
MAASPPVISLISKFAVEEIRDACSTWGAFVLTDHGIDDSLLTDVLQTGHLFFDLPRETKLKYNLQKHGSKWRGYMPFGGECSCKGKIQDIKEGLYLGDEHDADDPCIGLPTFGSNVYPDDEIPHMKDLFNEYHNQMKELGNRIMDVLSLGLGLPENCIQDRVTEGCPVILPRVFRYPPQQQEAHNGDEKLQGIGEHSDYGLWTMILTDAPGLEFCHPIHHTWHAVPFIPHAIIMNVGDVLDRLSAGRLVSTYHRVTNPSYTKARLSLPFFYDPSWDARMETLPLPELMAMASDDDDPYDAPERAHRWSRTKITCSFNQKPGVQYSEFLAKKVAKVFPSLIPESTWKSLSSTSEPSTRHALVVQIPDVAVETADQK